MVCPPIWPIARSHTINDNTHKPQCVMMNLNGLQPAAVTNIALCFGLTITILVYSFAGASPF